MALADEYREYARACLESASKAETEHERKQFLNMSRAWTQAALRLEGADPVSPIEDGIYPPESKH
jgi:hypothetical protein